MFWARERDSGNADRVDATTSPSGYPPKPSRETPSGLPREKKTKPSTGSARSDPRVNPAYLSRIVSTPPFLGPPDCGEALIRPIANRETLLQGPTSPSQADTP